ncbi:MAG: cobalamin-dependent protein [Candidatus Hadarchaeum sp.]|uniref:cobalamin B12-binding domain-containing protein n=1 Tax=Candidatus Hadarchaeum sp. TaxID=2883567 RepID=UPI003175AA3A
MSNDELFEKLRQSIFEYNEDVAKSVVVEILNKNIEPTKIFDEFASIAKTLGEKYENGELFLPELMLIADVMKAASDVIMSEIEKRKLMAAERKFGKVVIATVAGDIHDIGKNIVAFLLKVNGFEVYDLGRDVPSLEVVKRANETKADIIALSALMTTSMPSQREVIEILKGISQKEKFLVLIGGAPVTKEWAEEIGADGWADSAVKGVNIAKELMLKGGA